MWIYLKPERCQVAAGFIEMIFLPIPMIGLMTIDCNKDGVTGAT